MCESNPSDDMASFEVLNHNGMAESLDSSEFSIIQPPLEDEMAGDPNGNFNNMQSVFMAASQDLSMEEVQVRLVELAKDNAAMKGALERNNAMMKEQLSTISSWHNQMTTSMSKQQLSLHEAVVKVEALEAENTDLKGKLKKVETKSKDEDACSHDCKEAQTVAAHLEEAYKTMADLKLKMEEQNYQNGKNSQALASRFEEANQTIAEQKLKIEELSQTNCQNSQTVDSRLEEKNQAIVELNLKIEQQNAELETLRQNVELKDCQIASYELLSEEYEALKKTCSNLQDQLKEKAESDFQVQFLKMQLSDLETRIVLEQHATDAECVKLADTKKLLNSLQAKYDRVSRLLQAQSQNQDGQNSSTSFQQTEKEKQYLEQVDNLTAQLFELQDKLAEREEKVEALASQLETANKDSESIPVLKSQVEVYKLDLDNAKEAREEAEKKIESLNRTVRELEGRLEVSFTPLEGFTSTRPKSKLPGKLVSVTKAAHVGGARQGAKLYVCPICDFGFSDPQAAQNHANKCLDDAQIR